MEGGRGRLGGGATEAAAASWLGRTPAAVREEETGEAGRRLGLWPSRRAGVFFKKIPRKILRRKINKNQKNMK